MGDSKKRDPAFGSRERGIDNRLMQAPSRKASARGTSPAERGTASSQIGLDRGVDLGGQWDEHGVYWYADEGGRIWVWTEARQQWKVLSTPADAIKLRGQAPISEDDRLEAEVSHNTIRRWVQVPMRQYVQNYGLSGAPMIFVGKLAADAVEQVEQVIPPELSASVLPGMVLLSHNKRRLEDVEAEIAAEKDRRDRTAEAQIAHEHGELFQMQVVVASTEEVQESAPPDPMVVAGTTTKTGKPARSPVRVEAFIRDITTTYRKEIAKARQANPRARASQIGIIAERQTLAQVDKLARARGLNPGHIHAGNFPVGVTGPRGGVISADLGSPHFGFMLELKKSPKAKHGFQAAAHLLAIGYSLNFPDGGVYARIYGEGYKGAGVDRQGMGADLAKQKPKLKRSPRGR